MALAASLLATGVSATFAAALLRRFFTRGGANRALAFWGASLAMFALASAMLAAGELAGWSAASFRTFYLFGGVLNVPWLALGSVEVNRRQRGVSRATGVAAVTIGALLLPGVVRGSDPGLWLPGAVLGLVWGIALLTTTGARLRTASLSVVGAFTLAATAIVLGGDFVQPLPVDGLPEGREVFPAAVRGWAVGGNAVGAVMVIVSAVASSLVLVWGRPAPGEFRRAREDATQGYVDVLARWVWSGRRGADVRHLVRGNLLIALGVTVAGMGGVLSFLGATTGHAVGLGVGVSIMFVGFVRTLRPATSAPSTRQEPAVALTLGTGRRRYRSSVEVYTRENCGLCRTAEEIVGDEAGRASVRMIDVDQDEDLQRRYGLRVPVIVVDGREVAEGQVEPGSVRLALRRARQGRWAEWRPA